MTDFDFKRPVNLNNPLKKNSTDGFRPTFNSDNSNTEQSIEGQNQTNTSQINTVQKTSITPFVKPQPYVRINKIQSLNTGDINQTPPNRHSTVGDFKQPILNPENQHLSSSLNPNIEESYNQISDYDFDKIELNQNPSEFIQANQAEINEETFSTNADTNTNIATSTANSNLIYHKHHEPTHEPKPVTPTIPNTAQQENKMSKKASIIAILLILFLLLGAVLFGIYLAQDKLAFWNKPNGGGNTSIEEVKSVGTFAVYEEGKVAENEIGGDKKEYKNELFPNFTIASNNGNKWTVTQSDKSKGNQLKYDVVMKSEDLNLIFSFYSDNGGLKSGTVCLKSEDITQLSSFWSMEKRLNEVYEEHIGYYFMPTQNYFTKQSPQFDALYENYKTFISGYTSKIIPKSDTANCSSAQRVIKTKTSKENTTSFNTENEALLRIFTPKTNLTEQEIVKIKDLIATLKY